MAGNPHFRPHVVDENGNPVLEIPRSTGTIFYHYETRIVDRMPVPRRPRSKSALEKLKEVINSPEELLRVPGNMLKVPKARPVSWGGASRGEGRYYYVDQYGRTIETTATRTPNPPAPSASGGNFAGAIKVAKDKDVIADAAERLHNAALFARIGSGGVSGSSGTPAPGSGVSGTSLLGSGTSGTSGGSGLLGSGGSGGSSSGLGTTGFSGGSSLFDW